MSWDEAVFYCPVCELVGVECEGDICDDCAEEFDASE